MQLIGKEETPAKLTPEEAAAKQARDREEAAHRIKQYLIAKIVNPSAARRVPDMVDLQMLLDERKQLYELLQQGQIHQIRTLALVLAAGNLERVDIPANLFEELEGCAIRQNIDAETNVMTLELVRPPAKEDAP